MSESIEVYVNGSNARIRAPATVIDYLRHEKIEGRFLVVLNDAILPKSLHQTTQLQAGDKLDIMSPISGG